MHLASIYIAAYLNVHVDGPEDIPSSSSTCHAERGHGLLLTCTRAQRRSESCDSCGRVIEMQRNNGVFRFVGSIDYLPHGGGAKRPLISSASRQGTSSRSKLSFSHRHDFLLLICIHYTHCVMTLLIDRRWRFGS
jgi:hypothetical protein